MAEPTTKDILDALAQVEKRLAARIDERFAKVDEQFAKVAKRFDDLDAELTGHNGEVHRDLEADVAMLKKAVAKKPVTARKPRPRARWLGLSAASCVFRAID